MQFDWLNALKESKEKSLQFTSTLFKIFSTLFQSYSQHPQVHMTP